MENPVFAAFWQDVRADFESFCAEYGMSAPDMRKVLWVRAKMSDLKYAKKIRKIISDPRLLIYDWLFGERPADKPADSIGA